MNPIRRQRPIPDLTQRQDMVGRGAFPPQQSYPSAGVPAMGSNPNLPPVGLDAATPATPAAGGWTPATRITDQDRLGEFQTLRGTASQADQTILPRMAVPRNFLELRNIDPTNGLYYDFDRQASAAQSYYIPPGGSAWFDTVVPQNDIHVLGGAAAVQFQLTYAVRSQNRSKNVAN